MVGQDQSVDLGKTCPPICPHICVSMDLSVVGDLILIMEKSVVFSASCLNCRAMRLNKEGKGADTPPSCLLFCARSFMLGNPYSRSQE